MKNMMNLDDYVVFLWNSLPYSQNEVLYEVLYEVFLNRILKSSLSFTNVEYINNIEECSLYANNGEMGVKYFKCIIRYFLFKRRSMILKKIL